MERPIKTNAPDVKYLAPHGYKTVKLRDTPSSFEIQKITIKVLIRGIFFITGMQQGSKIRGGR